MRILFFDHAFLPDGWARDVRLEVVDGAIRTVEAGSTPVGAERIAGIALPGVPNLHSHAFQRGMAGLAESRGPADDTFWTWRQVMYRFLGILTPDDVEAISAFAYMEMLESGYTSVGEFHYLHHAPDGRPYADPAEMAGRVAAAAIRTGMGLTLLPVFYANATFGAAPPLDGQRRFISRPEAFLRLAEAARRAVLPVPDAALGVAPHSLRAVTPESLAEVLAAAPQGPVHMHAAEQVKEVEDCVAWSGERPVEWLLRHCEVGPRWCLVHATHMTADECRGLARSGAVAGLCPLTEASLGDGIFAAGDYLAAGGRFGIGSDSNIQVTPAGELRQLEYGQRLMHRGRNILAAGEGSSTGRRLLDVALAGGRQALGRRIGALAPGDRADVVVLDPDHPDLAGRSGDRWLDAWIFVADRSAVRTVIAGGKTLVAEGVHAGRPEIAARYAAVLRRVLQA